MPAAEDFLATPLQFLKGVGPQRAADLARAGLETVDDLLHRFPFRYEDRVHVASIASLKVGQDPRPVLGDIVDANVRYTRRRGFKIFEALVRDESGSLLATWPNQTYLQRVLARGKRVVLYGRLEHRPGGVQMSNPDYEIWSEEDEREDAERIHSHRIVPIYKRTGQVTPRRQRELVFQALSRLPESLPDQLPEAMRVRLGLPGYHEALWHTHFPPEGTSLAVLQAWRTPSQQRLILEEFFFFQLGLLVRRRDADAERKPFETVVTNAIRQSARNVLPFRLTPGQRAALSAIVEDMQKPVAMNRLLQGDVGAGKTIVALLAAVVAMENSQQAAFMAPTEILAEQHYRNISRLLALSRFRVELLTGATPAPARRELLSGIASGAVHLVVGTHALVQERVNFHRLGLVVIDEQHRFGVMQRSTLRKKGQNPDVLVMTATPIPRTLALTVHGDLDVSSIKDLPPGRQAIRTEKRPDSARDEVYRFLRRQLEAGRQAYVVYPLVEESAKIDLKAATEMADHLASDVFPEFRVALLHGRMKQDAKDRVMRAFADGQIQILASTTVIEVGIDVANATVMVVEHAERFGLSQLHQLRGRVGRGGHASFCVLLYQAPVSDEAESRLNAMVDTTDGFVIAERDLQLRGAGDFFGTRQSGVPTLRIGDVVRDHALVVRAREEAERCLASGGVDHLIARVRETWARRFQLADVG